MKRIVASGIFLMSVICGYAQNVQFGVKAGANISWESDHEYVFTGASDESGHEVFTYNDSGFKKKKSFHIGGVMNWMLSKKFDVETDLIYSMQGYKDEYYEYASEEGASKREYSVTSHYLTVPVTLKFYPESALYFECGPQMGFLLWKKNVLFDTNQAYDDSKKIDIGLLVGMGTQISEHLFCSVRYVHGLTNTSKVYNGGKNRNIQLSLSYMF